MNDNEKYIVMNAVKDAQEKFLTHARYNTNQLETELYRRIYVAMYNLLSALDLGDEFESWDWGDDSGDEEG